jgi:hypothetical protein
MALREEDGIRTVGVNGTEFKFERGAVDKAGRMVRDKEIVALWTTPLKASTGFLASATVNEFNDGVLYGPSSVPGTFSDFAGAAATEVTVRWLELTNEHLARKLKRQREMIAITAGFVAVAGILAIAFRGM